MDLYKVLRFLSGKLAAGEPVVMVTVCAVQGSSMRNPGTLMGVSASGDYEGSLSGGCIESAVVSEARDVLQSGKSRVTRYGKGSPYIDIKLPCGGGLDLHFQPLNDDLFIRACLASITAREPFSIALNANGASHCGKWQETYFDAAEMAGTFGHWPAPRLNIIGHGASVTALHDLAESIGCETAVFTPDARVIDTLRASGVNPTKLEKVDETGLLTSDLWSAFVFLFHDHDWEIDLIEKALTLPHFYIGAMGGRKAHIFRTDALKARGVPLQKIDTVRAPIGLFHSSRDPHTLALSTLSEVIRAYQDSDFAGA